MARLPLKDAAAVRDISAELDTIRLGRPPVLDTVLPELGQLLEVESMLAVRMAEQTAGWQLDLFHHHGFPRAAEFASRFRGFFAAAPPQFAWYSATRPEPEQRNRVVEAIERIPPGQYEASAIYRDVMAPLRLQAHRQLRVLVCEGPALLAWVGAFHLGTVDARQRALLAAAVPALQRRLSVDRRMSAAPRVHAALAVMLNSLGAPAFVLGKQGDMQEMNEAARALLATAHRRVAASLRNSVLKRPSELAFELTSLREGGTSVGWLAVLRSEGPAARVLAGVAAAATHWGLTPRQHQVLELVARGMANATIAATLGVGERVIELHVSALLDRAGVDGRAALVARVLSRYST